MKRIWIGLFLIITAAATQAQDGALRLTVNRNTLGVDELLQVSYTLSGRGTKWKVPSFADWVVVAGPNVSSSYQSINGQTSQTTNYTFMLQPTKAGKFIIPAASVEFEGKMVSSNTAEITVTGGSSSQKKENQKSDEEIFIRVTLDKTKALVGEQITLTYKIYTRIPVRSYNLVKVPSWAGFWAQDMEMPNQITLTPESVGGVTYQVGVLRRQALFAQKTGNFTFDPVELDAIVRKRVKMGGAFDDPFFDDPFLGVTREVQVKLKSNSLKIAVVDFPQAMPGSFSGVSGNVTLQSSISAQKTKANEAITLKITVKGDGNIKMIPDFKLKLPAEIETYDPKVSESITSAGGKVSGSKTYEYLLIPRSKGNYKIDPQEFVYFNLNQRKFVKLTTPAYNIEVEKGDDNALSGPVVPDKQDIDLLTRDLRYIKTGPLSNQGKSERGSPLRILLTILPLALGGAGLWYRNYLNKEASGGTALRQTRAAAMAKRKLKKAEKLMGTNDKAGFYKELSQGIWEYLRDKLKMHNADLTRDIVESQVNNAAATVHITTLWKVLDDCELAQFAPSAPGLNMQEAYNKAAIAIKDLEGVI